MKKYLIISFGWTYFFWILAMVLAYQAGVTLDTELTIFSSIAKTINEGSYINLIFSVGVFGPLVAFLFTKEKGDNKLFKLPSSKWLLLTIAIAIVPVIIPFGYLLLTSSFSFEFSALLTIGLYFLANFITSGTEEIGWRGRLLKMYLKKGKSFWDTNFTTGVIWAVWHYPLMVFLYYPLGVTVMLSSLAGFTMAIVGMAYISNWLMLKTKSLPLLMFFHALNNTLTYAIMFIFKENPLSMLSILFVWGIVLLIEKRYLPKEGLKIC